MMKNLFLFFSVLVLLASLSIISFAQMLNNQQPDLTIDASTRVNIINRLLKELNDSYIFPEIAQKIEADFRQKLQNKEYDKITSSREFADKLTADLQAVSRDKHLRVRFSSRAMPDTKDDNSQQTKEANNLFLKFNNYGFIKTELLRGNIGYIDLRGFTDADAGAETVAAAMNFIANTDALIFDLRQNGGGSPEMVALISSYLFGDKPVHLNDFYKRKNNETKEFWTKPTVLGKKYGDKDVYILTSNRTFSAAEEFSNNLKVLKRATIVGETTAGGANPGGIVRLNEHFSVNVPTARAVNPITKTNWEGTGVEPDVKVSKELALNTAYLMALNKSLEKVKPEQMKSEIKRMIEQTQKEIEEAKKDVKSGS